MYKNYMYRKPNLSNAIRCISHPPFSVYCIATFLQLIMTTLIYSVNETICIFLLYCHRILNMLWMHVNIHLSVRDAPKELEKHVTLVQLKKQIAQHVCLPFHLAAIYSHYYNMVKPLVKHSYTANCHQPVDISTFCM